MKSKFSHIAVVGSGAVGCFFGGMLARAGHRVTLIGREQHVQAIRERGLHMSCQSFETFQPIGASTSISEIAHADLILVCVKSPDSEKTAQEMKPYLRQDAVILSLQNGVDNAHRIGMHLAQPTFATVVYVATAMSAPGHLKHFGRGELVIGDVNNRASSDKDARYLSNLSALQSIADLFSESGVPCNVSEDIARDLWSKFLVNCTYNAISAIGQITYGEMTSVPAVWELIKTLTREFLAVAAAEGIKLSFEEAMTLNEQIKTTMTGQKSSTAQDLARGKTTEIEFLNGFILRKGHEHRIATPSHETVYTLVKLLEIKHA